MLKKAIILAFLASFLTSCVSGPDGYFKRSANNKIFDRKGFHGGKRSPLYNKKYIAQAKKNIVNGVYQDEAEDHDEYYEEENIAHENIEMYKAMIDEDLEREKNKTKKSRWSWGRSKKTSKKAYPSIVNASQKITPRTHADNLEMREELNQIKTMLLEAKRDLSSYQCPTAKKIEEAAPAPTPRPTIERKVLKAPEIVPTSTIIEPIKSI